MRAHSVWVAVLLAGISLPAVASSSVRHLQAFVMQQPASETGGPSVLAPIVVAPPSPIIARTAAAAPSVALVPPLLDRLDPWDDAVGIATTSDRKRAHAPLDQADPWEPARERPKHAEPAAASLQSRDFRAHEIDRRDPWSAE